MAKVTLQNVNKVYDNGFHAIHDVSLDIKDGEFMVLVGPSGCAKSTMLRMVAGLESITDGLLVIGDRECNNLPPKDRGIAMVFQNYALYPHMTAYENLAFGLETAKKPKTEIKERVIKAAELLEITDLLDRKPKQMSGGQRQRVALGRAMVRNPDVFLFDEPLSNPLLSTKAGFAINKGNPDFINFLNAWIIAHEADTWLTSSHKYWFKSSEWR